MKYTLHCMLTLCCCFTYVYAQHPNRYDIVINEIMANPSSSPGLPNFKYIELYNASQNAWNLNGWQISDGGTTAVIRVDFILQPGSFVLIGSNNAAPALSDYGAAIGVSNFPTLRVNGDLLSLVSDEGLLVHAVAYKRNWYNNDVKSTGGWSLEMIDAHNPCGDASNWKASTDPKGGTPAQQNSVAGKNKDETAPHFLRAYPTDNLHVTLVFDEPLDSISAIKENFVWADGPGTAICRTLPPLFNTVELKLNSPLQKNKIYTLHVKNLRDCSGNTNAESITTKIGLAEMPVISDIVINEILFNPSADGVDYVEIYNRGKHIINANNLYISNRNASGNTGTLKQVTAEDIFIFPGDFIVITENADIVKQQYLAKNPQAFIELSAMPSYANTSGTVVLFNSAGEVLDELSYTEKWHFNLITNYKGVALERIDYDKPTQDNNNWHSAAASAGYGTPGYQNSQYKSTEPLQGEINISPKTFSPDNDGHDDFLVIDYRFPQPGYVCNISIFDARGRPVRQLVRNGLCGTEGYFRWDGVDEKNQPTSTGIYIVLTEVYNPQGKTQKFKQAVTVARLRW